MSAADLSLCSAGAFFVVGLAAGVWKYAAIATSTAARAPDVRGHYPPFGVAPCRHMQIAGAPGGRGGGITVVQRVSSDLRCNPHVHGIFVDGVFVPAADGGKPTFHALPHLSDTAVADVVQISRT